MQTGGLLNDFTVEETVRAIAALHGRTDRVEIVLQRAHLTDLARRRVEACSGGEQQRLKFALALVPDPDLVILDEPTAGMDVGARQEFWQAMRADAAHGRTIVFATHYLAEADEFAERTVLMNHGRIVHDAPTADVRAAYGGRTVTFRPPADMVGSDGIDAAWLAHVQQALEPLGVTGLEVSAASLEAAFLALTAESPADHSDHPDSSESHELTGAVR
jgi:ABC-2 type transport system ATP-binding protein